MAVSALNEVTERLQQHQNLPRIKKLLIYACYNTWEIDRHRLDQYHLSDLIHTLAENAPTLEQLKCHLARIVQTLNKSAEYTLVANAIVTQMGQLYPETTQIVTNSQQFAAVAQILQQDADAMRLKKMLWCACTQIWENDPQQLSALNFSDLVRNLHELAPTPTQVEAVLESIIQTLNRQSHYRQVTRKILNAFQPLYGSAIETALFLPAMAAPVMNASAKTGAVAIDHSPQNQQPDSKPIVNQSPPINPLPDNPLPDNPQLDRFDLRLEIIKYANPLRVKILIFSALHEVLDVQNGEWMTLKNHELDDLLQALSQECRTAASLQSKLHEAAKALKSRDYVQIADAIVRALQPFYDGDRRSNNSQNSVDESDATGVEGGRSNLSAVSDDQTCQLLALKPKILE